MIVIAKDHETKILSIPGPSMNSSPQHYNDDGDTVQKAFKSIPKLSIIQIFWIRKHQMYLQCLKFLAMLEMILNRQYVHSDASNALQMRKTSISMLTVDAHVSR